MAKVNTISFGSAPDLQVQQSQLQRKQQMIDMLRQQAAKDSGTQMVGQVAVRNSPLGGVSQIVQALLAEKLQQEADTTQRGLGQEASKRQAEALRALAPAGVFEDATPTGMPADTPQGFTPPADKPQVDQATRERWARAIATYQQNPELGGKLIQDLSKEAEYSTTPQYDQQGNAYVLNNRGERKALDGVRARDKLENVNGVWQNPYAQQNGAVGPQDFNQPFMAGPDGKMVANTAYQNYRKATARAGASSVSVNTASKPFLTEIGKGAGEAVTNAFNGAQEAVKTLQNVEQIRSGLGNAILGPGANARVTLSQLGQTLGVTGQSTAEQLQNTRNVMQGLARQELTAAAQMKGQGQITESERAILRKAESGQISEMTSPEIKTMLGALERSANYRINLHKSNMERLRRDPNAAGVVDYMQVETPAVGVDDLLKKYGGK